MMRFSSATLALLISFSASAQTQPPDPTKQDDTITQLKALNEKMDTLMKAMQGQLAPPKVNAFASFATPFPVACHGRCGTMAMNACEGMGFTNSWVPDTPPIPGAPPNTYAYFVCYGRK